MAPYHTMKNGQYVADGLLMGCSNTGILQPSLQQFYEGIAEELYEQGDSARYSRNPDVSYLARQGVFMYNASLTTEVNKPGSHLDIWHPFTKYVIEEILNPLDVPIVFLGKDAEKFDRYVLPFNWSFVVQHPASAAYKGTQWSGEGVFQKVNKILKDNNNFKIEWLQ